MAKKKKFIISVSFKSDDKEYEYAKDKPNSSYYIRELIKEDMEKNKKESNTTEEIDIGIDINNFL